MSQRVLKLGKEHSLSAEELKIVVVKDYKYPVVACMPGAKVPQGDEDNGYGTAGCYVRHNAQTDINCITCYHCICEDRSMDIFLQCRHTTVNGNYLFGTLVRNDIAIIKCPGM